MKVAIISLILINFLFNFITGLKLKGVVKNNEFIKELLEVKDKLGHYEKYNKIEDVVVFVPGDKPSGIPGAFVVSKEEAQGVDPRKPKIEGGQKIEGSSH